MLVSYLSDSERACVIIGANGFLGNSISIGLQRYAHRNLKSSCTETFDNYYDIHNIIPWSVNKITTEMEIIFILAFGKGGFKLSKETSTQLHKTFVSIVNDISQRLSPPKNVIIYYISSLGASLSNMTTPYKVLNRKNEEYLRLYTSVKSISIRIPSIWGFNICNNQTSDLVPMGILGNLLASAKNNNTITIFGDSYTTRLYLSLDTISKYIACYILNNSANNSLINEGFEIISVASIRTYSIEELIFIVRNVTKKKLIVKYTKGIDIHAESHYISNITGHKVTQLENIYVEVYRTWTMLNQLHSR